LVLLLSTSGPTTATQDASADNNQAYTPREQESVDFYLASEGAIEDAYFTSAMARFKANSPELQPSKLAAAELISRHSHAGG
jgi:hypothetical protein